MIRLNRLKIIYPLSVMMKTGLSVFIIFFITFAVSAESQNNNARHNWADHSKTPPTGPIVRHYEPMVIGCHDLDSLLGISFSELALYAWFEDHWQVIPYQLDDRLPNSRMVFPMGPEANPEDANNQLDPEDELVFMVRDAGIKKEKTAWPENVKKGVEIIVADPVSNAEGFVYLFYIPGSKTDMNAQMLLKVVENSAGHASGSKLWSVEGMANEHAGKIYKTLINQSISIPPLAGGSGMNFIDRMKMRYEVRFLFGVLKLKLDEGNMIGEVNQFRHGPIRLSSRAWAQITLPAKLKSPKMWTEINLYETLTVAALVIEVKHNPGAVVTDFRMSNGYDLNDHAKGMKYYNSKNLKGFTIDGITTEDEQNMDTGLDDWGCVTGPQGSLLLYTEWDEEYKAQAKVNTYFIDDKTQMIPPEDYPGQMGYFYTQSVMESLKPRDYKLTYYVCFPPHFYDPEKLKMDVITEYLNITRHPTYAMINGKKNENRVAKQQPLWKSEEKR